MAITQKHIVIAVRRLRDEHGAAEGRQDPLGLGCDQAEPHRRAPARRRSEGRALVQGPRALHDAHVQRAHGRQQGHPVRAVLRIEFLSRSFRRSTARRGIRRRRAPIVRRITLDLDFEARHLEGRDAVARSRRGSRARRHALHDVSAERATGSQGTRMPETALRREARGQARARASPTATAASTSQRASSTRISRATRTTCRSACFIPRGPNAAEGEGYLIGVASNYAEGARSWSSRTRSASKRATSPA